MNDVITAVQLASEHRSWSVRINGQLLLGKNGVSRFFRTKEAAIKAGRAASLALVK